MTSDYEPSITEEMRERYLSRRETDVATLEAAFADSDFEIIRAIAHQIKGNAATFSCTDLESLAITLETQAERQSPDVQLTIKEMKRWLKEKTTGPR